jgi:hypothetical protein
MMCGNIGRLKIRPRGRNIRARAVRQDQDQMKLSLALQFTEYLKNLACERVV